MQEIETYNQSRFMQIKDKIFLNGGETYFNTLAHFKTRVCEFSDSFYERFLTGQTASPEWMKRKIEIFAYGFLFLLLSFAIAYFSVNRWCPKKWQKPAFLEKKKYYVATITAFLFTFLTIFSILFLLERYYFILATSLFLEYILLVAIVLLSITLRIDAKHIKHDLILYLPILCTGAVLILYRITLVSNIILSFSLPIILLASFIVQLIIIKKHAKGAYQSDMFCAWSSLVLTTISFLLSWFGFPFLGLQLMMFWLVFLTGIQALICLRHLLGLDKLKLIHKHHNNEEPAPKNNWFVSLMTMFVMPILGLLVFVGSVLWAAHIFSLSPWVWEKMQQYFIDLPDVAMVSFEKIIWLIIITFTFVYFTYFTKEILRSVFKERYFTGVVPVCVTIGTILAWGIYAIVAILMLNINNNGLIAAVGGMSMGIGFALKDTIDNLFCGLSLMLGRVRPGDMIECDGIRGRITSVGVRSTMLEAVDGSIIAFSNNQLFAKNFKNLTKNHNYEIAKILVGIAYGSDVDKARDIISNCLAEVKGLAPGKSPSIFLDQFGSSSIDLVIVIWAPVDGKGAILSAIKEKIYKAFNEAGISIPFPQQDVYIHPVS